jgi:hypothetical protein
MCNGCSAHVSELIHVVYVPPLPYDLQELRQRIIAAVATIKRDMLERVWTEMDCRIDVCRVTRGSHIECL